LRLNFERAGIYSILVPGNAGAATPPLIALLELTGPAPRSAG